MLWLLQQQQHQRQQQQQEQHNSSNVNEAGVVCCVLSRWQQGHFYMKNNLVQKKILAKEKCGSKKYLQRLRWGQAKKERVTHSKVQFSKNIWGKLENHKNESPFFCFYNILISRWVWNLHLASMEQKKIVRQGIRSISWSSFPRCRLNSVARR